MTVENLIWTVIGGVLGFMIGLPLDVNWTRKDGEPAVRVTLSSRWQRMFFIAVSSLAVLTTVITAMNASAQQRQTESLAAVTEAQQQAVARQSWCNAQIIGAITGNATIAAADRDNVAALLDAIANQILNPTPDPAARRAAIAEAFRHYQDRQAANQASRKPYPPPDCGK